MKKVLLLSAAMLTMSLAASAQEAVKADLNSRAADRMNAMVAPVSAVACDVQYDAAAPKTSRRTIADGVSYGRPDGTFYISGTTTSGSKYMYLYIPAGTPVTYKNYATNKADAKWYYGKDEPQVEGDENNDFTVICPKISRGYVSYSYLIPTMEVGDVRYKYADELTPNSQALINGDSIMEVAMHVNRMAGMYYGFKDGAVFGTGDRNVKVGDETVACWRKNIVEIFKKPAAPYCLYGLYFPVVSYNDAYTTDAKPVATDFIPKGTTMHLQIIKLDEKGMLTDDVLADIPFTAEDVQDPDLIKAGIGYASFQLARMTEDEFGTPIPDPVLINDPFAVIIDGFDQPGVNFSLYMVDVMATERDYYDNEGGEEGTLCQYVRQDNRELVNDTYYYCQSYPASSEYARQYNAAMYLNGMFDVVNVDEEFKIMTAPVEGGDVYAELEGTEGPEKYNLQYFTTRPRLSDWEGIEGSENYQFVDVPEWLHIGDFDDSNYEDYNVTIVKMTADALPSGIEGRYAKIRITSDMGADSGIIFVTQGTVDLTGIKGVKAIDNKVQNDVMYNMAGQRVNNDFKGLVIMNGQKMIMK